MKDEVVSAVQKLIRRGEERDACFFASELDLNGNGNHCWERLVVITAEDVGLGCSESVRYVHNLYKSWRTLVGKSKLSQSHSNEEAKHLLMHAVIYLSRVPKSRMAATSSFVFLDKYDGSYEVTNPVPKLIVSDCPQK